MESANVNDDSHLDARLQRHDSAPLADDGFSNRVLAALPPPRRARTIVPWHLWTLVGVTAAWAIIWGPRLAGSAAANGTAALSTALDALTAFATQPEMLIVLGAIALALALTNPENLAE